MTTRNCIQSLIFFFKSKLKLGFGQSTNLHLLVKDLTFVLFGPFPSGICLYAYLNYNVQTELQYNILFFFFKIIAHKIFAHRRMHDLKCNIHGTYAFQPGFCLDKLFLIASRL